MTTVTMHKNTTVTPAQFIAGLTDFGPGRADLFPNSADSYLKVHELGDTYADVTEGSGGVWERLYYDWSNANHVVLTTTDSNAWGRNSGHTYTLTPKADGTTDVTLVSVREGKNAKGRLLATLFAIGGKKVLVKAFNASVQAIEARNTTTTPKAA